MDVFDSEKPWVQMLAKAISNPIEWFIPRIAINPSETVWKPYVAALETEAKLAGETDWVKYFNEHGKGFQPPTKSLRFSSLREQNLPHCQLSGAQLQGADLEMAAMQGVYLSMAQLQGANLRRVQLQGADLSDARLQATNLEYAQLQGADLRGTKLQSADLVGAELQGIIISNGAYFPEANFGKNRREPIPVFELIEKKGFLISDATTWAGLEKKAEEIADPKLRESYLGRIRIAAKSKINENVYQYFYHAPDQIAQAALASICENDFYKKNMTNIPSSAQAFRRQYKELYNPSFFNPTPQTNKEYQDLLVEIDRKLCTLPECADIRDKIDGLNCQPFVKESQISNHSGAMHGKK